MVEELEKLRRRLAEEDEHDKVVALESELRKAADR